MPRSARDVMTVARPEQADYESLAAFRYALRRFFAFSGEAALASGLTAVQHQALLSIKGHPARAPMTIGQLAEHLFVAPHTAAELVGRLEAGGMIARVRDATDRRRVGLRLTPRADAVLRKLSDIHLREIREMAPGLIRTLSSLLSSDGDRSRVA